MHTQSRCPHCGSTLPRVLVSVGPGRAALSVCPECTSQATIRELSSLVKRSTPGASEPCEPPKTMEDANPVPCAERAYQALLLLRHGHSLEEIARGMPNRSSREASLQGLSAKSAEIIIRQGARTLLSGILRDTPPPTLPAELWPPQAVRSRIRDADGWRTQLRLLRAWLETKPAAAKAQPAASQQASA